MPSWSWSAPSTTPSPTAAAPLPSKGSRPGSYTLQVSTPTGEATEVSLEIGSGESVTLSLEVDAILNDAAETIVVTGTRDPEKRIDVPENVESRTAQDIERSGGASYLSVLADVKGIDFSSSGLGDQRISARGFVTQFNSRMLSMVDGRVATLPGAGLPQANLLPTSTLDMKALEVVIGPASAMYGPNAHTGVINVLTKSPWDQPGRLAGVSHRHARSHRRLGQAGRNAERRLRLEGQRPVLASPGLRTRPRLGNSSLRHSVHRVGESSTFWAATTSNRSRPTARSTIASSTIGSPRPALGIPRTTALL